MLCLRGERLITEKSSKLLAMKKRLASAGYWLRFAVKTHPRLIFLAFVIIYASLLLINLGYMSLQWDEMPHLYGSLLLTRGQTSLYLTTYGYYPPLFDLVTAGYLQIFSIGAEAGRLVSVTFALLALWVVYELTSRMYGSKNALLASILLCTMPGFFWVSRVTMLETILMFFFTLIMFFFYSWITENSNKALFFSGLTLGIGILAKYEILVAALAMTATVLLLLRKRLKISLAKLMLILIVAVLVVAPWFLAVYQLNGMTKFQTVQYVMQSGAENRPEYSERFFSPVFYLIEITWPYNYAAVHPVSLPIIILGLCGLALFAYRRRKQDIFLLTWFLVVYVFFTVIPNKQWRYVDPLFPILAISAAGFIIFLFVRVHAWKPKQIEVDSERLKKFAAALFIVLFASTIAYCSYDTYLMTARDQIHIPVDEATNYLAGHLGQNQSAVLICATNLLDQNMFRFYLPANMSKDQIWQYPDLAVDAFKPNFNITEFLLLCQQRSVKYIILFDYGPHMLFYNSTLDYAQVLTMIYNTSRFGDPLDQPFFGEFSNNKGYRLFLVRFLG
jgi:4-amino-4-deoxy-L-arabinose transferase-like glycosyltransferase